MIFLAVTLVGFLIASYQDLKTREISPYLSWGMVVIGLGMHFAVLITTGDPVFFIESAIFTIACFLFGYFLKGLILL